MSVAWSVFFSPPFCFISMDRGPFLSWNVSLIIRIWRGLRLIGGMYQVFVYIDQWNGVWIHENLYSWSRLSLSTVGITTIVYGFAYLIRKSKQKSDKQNVQKHKPHSNLKDQLVHNYFKNFTNTLKWPNLAQFVKIVHLNHSVALVSLWSLLYPTCFGP